MVKRILGPRAILMLAVGALFMFVGSVAEATTLRFPAFIWQYEFDGITAFLHGHSFFAKPRRQTLELSLHCSKESFEVFFIGSDIPDVGDRIAPGASRLFIGNAELENPWIDAPNFKTPVAWYRNGLAADSNPSLIKGTEKPNRISAQQFFKLIKIIYDDYLIDAVADLEDTSKQHRSRVAYRFDKSGRSVNQRRSSGAFHQRCEKLR